MNGSEGELKAFTCEKLINGPLHKHTLISKGEQLKVILEEHFAGKRNFETLIWNLFDEESGGLKSMVLRKIIFINISWHSRKTGL